MPLGNWVEITPAPPLPPARKDGAMAYDRLNSKTLLFGGNDGVSPLLSDTWLYTPGTTSWQQQFPAASPSARQGAAACDSLLGPHIFGGDTGSLSSELWLFNATNWELRGPGVGDVPVARSYAAIARAPTTFEGGAGDILLWGGDTGGLFDYDIWVWSFSANTWYRNESYTKPQARTHHAMYYDAQRDRVVMFGGVSIPEGVPLNDLWECDGYQWMPLTTLKRPTSRRCWQGMAYDPTYKRAALAPTGIGARGTITCYAGKLHSPGDYFVLDDGLNPKVTFELVPIRTPRDVIMVGGGIPTSLRFDLTSLFATPADPDASSDYSGTSIYLRCSLTGAVQSAISTFIGGVNYADSADLMGQSVPPSNQPGDYRVGRAPVPGNVVIEAERLATVNTMRDAIAAGVNAAVPLDIAAYGGQDGIVNLYNTRGDINGNTASATSVSVGGFVVSDMAGAESENWTYNRSGGLWLEHPEGSLAPVLDGASLVHDDFGGVFVLFGGEAAGVLQDKQYEWQWSNAGISPLYSLPGGFQGRLQPQVAQATDGSWAYILGADMPDLPSFLLDIGDAVQLKQEISLGGQRLLRFDWRMRYSAATPQYEKLIDAAIDPVSVDFRTSGLILPTSGADSVFGIRLAQPLFRRAHANQLCRITGADSAANDGTYRISEVPSDIGEIGAWGAGGGPTALQAGMVAILENGAIVHDLANANVTLEILGAQWRAQLYINDGTDDVLCAELVESRVQVDPDGWQRGSMAANISKLSAVTTLTFVLKLESTNQ